jgi:hypothetical protein
MRKRSTCQINIILYRKKKKEEKKSKFNWSRRGKSLVNGRRWPMYFNTEIHRPQLEGPSRGI